MPIVILGRGVDAFRNLDCIESLYLLANVTLPKGDVDHRLDVGVPYRLHDGDGVGSGPWPSATRRCGGVRERECKGISI